jgi:hypothetical protein
MLLAHEIPDLVAVNDRIVGVVRLDYPANNPGGAKCQFDALFAERTQFDAKFMRPTASLEIAFSEHRLTTKVRTSCETRQPMPWKPAAQMLALGSSPWV